MSIPKREDPMRFYVNGKEHFGTFIRRHNVFVDLDLNSKFSPEEVTYWHYIPHKRAKELIDYDEFMSRKNACY